MAHAAYYTKPLRRLRIHSAASRPTSRPITVCPLANRWEGKYSKVTGNAGGKSSGAGAGATGAVTREIQRSLRGPDRGGTVTNIEVVIAGRSIEPEMVSIIDDMARLRRSRALSRMGA